MRSILPTAAAMALACLLQGCEPASQPAPSSHGVAATDLPADAAAAATDPQPPRQLGLCASCHGRDGRAVMANTPHLAGRDRDELLAAMQAYLDGSRDYAPMRAMLRPIAPLERERLADWFAAQPAVAAPDATTATPSADTTPAS